MAKNVKLTWTNPATVSDIDTIDLFRKAGDHTASSISDADFRSGADTVSSEAVGAANASQEYTENNVAAGEYTYGAYSKNAGGYGPGDRTDSTIVVT